MKPTVNQAFQTGHLWRRDVVLCSFSLPSSLSFSRGILRRFVFRLFPPSLLFTLLKDPIPSSLSSSLSWNVHVYIRREEKGMGAWNRYMEEWKKEVTKDREREREEAISSVKATRSRWLRGSSSWRGPKLLLGTRLAAIKAFQRRPSVRMTTSSDPENKPLVSNLSHIWSPVAGRGYEPSSTTTRLLRASREPIEYPSFDPCSS